MASKQIPKLPSNASVISKISYFLAVGCGSGLSKYAPGTTGSVAALLFLPVMMYFGFTVSAVAVAVLSVVGVFICDKTSKDLGVDDCGNIVFDEWVGQWIALLPLVYFGEFTYAHVMVSFILFRFFDILKPMPISWFDKKVKGGLGVMLDDIVAGALVAGVLMVPVQL